MVPFLISSTYKEFMILFRKKLDTTKCLGWLFQKRTVCMLGIETSCDDTGVAIVNSEGTVLANVLSSQQQIHTKYGGIIPPRAQDLHRCRIANVFEKCIDEAQIEPSRLDAIAVTTQPGLALSLLIGLRFARYLARKFKKPIIPVHHMEAHALQARMENSIPYPFLCLLISGGHCQLALIRGRGDIMLLGETLDDAPGEAFDKIARRLRLYLHPKYRLWNGGQAVEDAAKDAKNLQTFEFPLPLARQRNCNFSFAGIKNNSFRTIRWTEKHEGTPPDGIIKNYADFCSDLLRACSRHLMNRTQRAIEFCIAGGFLDIVHSEKQCSLVVSGGVANNDYIFNDITRLAEHYNISTYRPSKRYCSDNGVMIAWNGIEQYQAFGKHCLRWDYDEIDILGKAGLGKSLISDVERADIKCKWVQGIKGKNNYFTNFSFLK